MPGDVYEGPLEAQSGTAASNLVRLGRKRRAPSWPRVVPACGLLLLTGCDNTADLVLNTVLLAFEIVSVWV